MNTSLQEGLELARAVNDKVAKEAAADVRVVVAPPFVHLTEVVKAVDSQRIGVSAQNCATDAKGAFTGEVAAPMIQSTGASAVIIGHSERRSYYNETDEILLKKVRQALDAGLEPIFCIGEVLEEREANKQNEVVKSQLNKVVFQLTAEEFNKIVLAYEPVWAIGTGKTATPEQAQEMHAFIRSEVNEKFGAEQAENTSILYGGSCKPGNAKELFANADVDGGLIGGASLKADDFVAIINSF